MSFLSSNLIQPALVQTTWATPFGTSFFHVDENGQYVKCTLEELREEYQAWEKIVHGLRNLSRHPVNIPAVQVQEESELSDDETVVDEEVVATDSQFAELGEDDILVEVSGCTSSKLEPTAQVSVKEDNEAVDLAATSINKDTSCTPSATNRLSMIGADALKRIFGWIRKTDGQRNAVKKLPVDELDNVENYKVEVKLLSGVDGEEGAEELTKPGVKGILKSSMATPKVAKSVRWSADVVDKIQCGDRKIKTTVRSVKTSGFITFYLDIHHARREGLRYIVNIAS